MTSLSSTQRFIRVSLAGGLAIGLAILSGCGVGTSAGVSPTGPLPMGQISGTVHGGQQPVSNSAIQLWAVGSAGYGSDGTNLLGSHVVTTDGTGSFSISGDYTCPTNDTLVYLTATAGNPGLTSGTNNTAIKLVAALGQCGNLTQNTFVVVNEVTTAAAAVALGQYFSTTFGVAGSDNFGTANTTQAKVGLVNAFATVNNLVDFTTGNAITSLSIPGAAGTVTATPESAKLYTIADILAACVNSDGSGSSACQTTLFPDVTPDGKAQATDTLQAAVYMSLNPASNNSNGSTTNLTALYALQTPQSPFVGGAQPTDWTVGILYTWPAGLPEPQSIAADASGNIWVASEGSSANGNLAELSPGGSGLFSSNLSSSGNSLVALNPRNLAIDLNGNVWVPTSSSSGFIFVYNPTSGAATSLNMGKSPYGIAIDGNNNIFIGAQSTSATFQMSEYLNGTLATSSQVEFPLVGQTSISTFATNVAQPEYMAFDSSGNLWFDAGNAATGETSVYQLSNINVSSCGSTPFSSVCQVTSSPTQNTYTTVTAGPLTEPWGIAADSSGMWVGNSLNGTNNLTLLTSTTAGSDFGSSASVVGSHYLAVDGAGNVWAPNKPSPAPTSGSVSEFSSTGVILSPTATTVGFSHPGISISASSSVNGGITIDPSGNVWIANNVTSGADLNSVFELVGSAAPTVAPLAMQLKTSHVAQKP